MTDEMTKPNDDAGTSKVPEEQPSRAQLRSQQRATEKSSRPLKITALILGILLAIAAFAVYAQAYLIPQRDAQSILDGAVANRGAIEASNTELKTFTGQAPQGANSEQKALAQGGEITDPAMFVYTNGKSEDKPVLDFYLNFSDQRSRDAFIFNSGTLKALVESGQIELRVHSLLDGKAYSMYASEALAEVFAADSGYAWQALTELLRQAPSLVSIDDANAMAAEITETMENLGVATVSEESIQNGTFASWLLTVGDDPQLNSGTGVSLPLIVKDGKALNLSVDELNNADLFRKAVME